MNEPMAVANRLTRLFRDCFPGDDLKPFHTFWGKTFQFMGNEGFFSEERIRERTRNLIEGSTRFLQELKESDLTDDKVAEKLRQYLMQANLVKPGLSYYGYEAQQLENPESPIGFYRLLSPYPQPPDSFSVFAPCMANMIQRILDGATMCWLSSSLVFHKYVAHDEIKQLELVARKMHERFMKTVKKEKRDAAAKEIIDCIDRLKSFNPFFPLLNSQIFYEEGIRFYRQRHRKYYVSSTTSGLIIPEEFYGREFYYLGITRDFEPMIFSRKNYLRYDECQKLQDWEFHLQKVAVESFEKSEKVIKNPYRSRYFVDGITVASMEGGKEVHYQYDAAETAKALQKTYWNLPTDKRNLYLEDVRAIFGQFYRLHCKKNLILYENPNFREESTWITLSPGMSGFSMLSQRGEEEEKILHGWKLNVNSIWLLGLAADIFTMLMELPTLPGVALGTAIITQKVARKWVESRYNSLENEFVGGRQLPKWKSQTKQTEFVEKTVSRLIGV